MNIKDLPETVKNLNESDLRQCIFWNSVFSLCKNPLVIHKEHKILYPFITETLYEYYMRYNRNGDIRLTPHCLGDICSTIFNAQSLMLNKYGLTHLLTLFYLWQIENRVHLFSQLYRYDWIFSFQNKKINMVEEFNKKFKCDYIAFELLCVLTILLLIAMREKRSSEQIEYFKKKTGLLFQKYINVIKQLAITKEEYINYSEYSCVDPDLLTFSLKVSRSYPFLKEGDDYLLVLPHMLVPACSSSLLFRLTDNNNDLHSLIAKEVLEEYVRSLFGNQKHYSHVKREKEFNLSMYSSDVLIVEKHQLYCIEVKSFTPNHKTRLLDEKGIKKQINEVVDGMYQLYKFLFINYPQHEQFFKHYDKTRRYGILALREDASFNRRVLYEGLFKKIEKVENRKICKDEQTKILEAIKVSSLEELENFAFTNTPLSQLVNFYNQEGHYFDVTANRALNRYFNNKHLKIFERKIDAFSTAILGLL